VTIAKGTSSGTYKIKVKIKAAKTNVYKAKTISKTITVKVIVPNDKVNNDSSNNSTDASSETSASTPSGGTEVNTTYILNINTKVFHLPTCSSVKQMSEKNKKTYTGTKSGLISLGYKSCGRCKP
jgi:DNA-entry nuclease